MTRPDDHVHWEELAAGAALHALEPDEQLAFDAHAAGCARCRQLLDENLLVAAQLGALSLSEDADEAPPPEWSVIRAGIAPERAADGADELATARARRASRTGRGRAIAAAAAAVVVLAAGGTAAWQLTRPGQQSAPSAAGCTGIAGCRTLTLRDGHGTDLATLVVDSHSATLRPQHMPRLPSDRSYVLWQVSRQGRQRPLGAFGGVGTMSASLDLPLRATTLFAVSEEIAGPLPATPSMVLASTPSG
jgi:anti-sigma-K factor RskA